MSDDDSLEKAILDAHEAMARYRKQLENETDEKKRELIQQEIDNIKSRLRKIMEIFDRIMNND